MGSVVQDKYEKGCYYVDGQTWQVRVSCLGSRALLTQLWCCQSSPFSGRLVMSAMLFSSVTHTTGVSAVAVSYD
jgi:hypothetical protein